MNSTQAQIKQYELGRDIAFDQGDMESVERMNRLLAPLYAKQELELWSWVAKSQLRRHGLPAHRLFSEQDRKAAMDHMAARQELTIGFN